MISDEDIVLLETCENTVINGFLSEAQPILLWLEINGKDKLHYFEVKGDRSDFLVIVWVEEFVYFLLFEGFFQFYE